MTPDTKTESIDSEHELAEPGPPGLLLVEVSDEGISVAVLTPDVVSDLIACAILAKITGLDLAQVLANLEVDPPEGETGE